MPSMRTMPSIRRRSFFKKKDKNKSKRFSITSSGKSLNGSSSNDDRSTPTMITPI
eukprot:CAMPEP_0196252942 /NCGR_PEP_ID=MMETSP0913-20130531/50731_1 /TAXON_ID=49265 /ORGANISM="Thalassiosira rotula, Strain GSO102" /LENGTH=54 /DNA_ID=CAMNT_0041539713 /DNA_START=36 /DNA_END=197 /DNA_ORIENTATION=-